ncbi:TPA: MFS transporter [Vibrio parahaemolyticus]|uniref:MFS transporter n=1 Tax=Vibrio parahaemolyticus TaxID=670 RepID=UPI00084B3959|nr:MFS transporter [Vibrio parahaemolyticus]EJG1802532.1 MFS transporter [Vibrio parahaemolyticus]MBE3968623.1 MFS transporter [Vibrio parahaemolyticus]MBE5114771.1 MFS transporter [Vibrio parahaemolyticus]MBM4973965.1 MFS transporter [Vibrio parahaemolyticus]MBM5005764.1 MFS transporter [Vibrio parahaemolyticus]
MSRFLLCSFALVLLYPTAIDLYLVGLPQIASDLNASESQLHIAFSIYLAGMATTMLFAGKIADSVGRKPVAVVGAMIFVLASFLGGMAEQPNTFLIVRFCQGIGAGSCYVVAFAILRDTLDDERRAKVLSMLNGITCIIPVIAPVIGHLIMLKFPWPSLFTTMAGMGILVSVLAIFVLKESLPSQQGEEQTTPESHQETFFERFFISRLIITALGVTTILTFVNASPIVVMSMLGFDRGGYSSIMAGTATISMLISFSAPLALGIFKQRTLMMTSQVLLACAAIVLSAAHFHDGQSLYYVFGLGLICAGFACGFGVAMSQALSPFSQQAGVASSLLGIAQVCSSAFYIWFMGFIGVSALNMLVFILVLGSVISLALILLIPKPVHDTHYEEIPSAT